MTSYVLAAANNGPGLLAMENTVLLPGCMIPLQKNYLSDPTYNQVSEHIRDAQAGMSATDQHHYNSGVQPMLLIYFGPIQWWNDMNRDDACGVSKSEVKEMKAAGLSCDEYPYASTIEVGANGSIKGVSLVHNLAHGRKLLEFYRRAFGNYFKPGIFAAVTVP